MVGGSGRWQPTSEIRMHLHCYRARPDIRAVVHGHPTYPIAFSVAGVSLARCVLPEVLTVFGRVQTAAYSTPTTDEVPKAIARILQESDGLVLSHHGTLTVGPDLTDGYDKLEKLDQLARVMHAAMQIGGIRELPREQVAKLLALHDRPALPEAESCGPCLGCGSRSEPGRLAHRELGRPPLPSSAGPASRAEMIDAVSSEVLRVLQG